MPWWLPIPWIATAHGSRTAAHRRASRISDGIPGSRHASFSATGRSIIMSRASYTTPVSVRATSLRIA